MKHLLLIAPLLLCGCLGPVASSVPEAKPNKPQSSSLRSAYFAALADGLESGWYASPNEFLARAKVTRERLKLDASGASVDGIRELQGASVKPFDSTQRASVVASLRKLAGG